MCLVLQFEAGLYPTAKVVYATYALSEFLGKAPAITEVGILSCPPVMIAITEHIYVFRVVKWFHRAYGGPRGGECLSKKAGCQRMWINPYSRLV